MKRTITLLAFTLIAVCIMAMPAKRVWITITQSDGSEICLMPYGDENRHYYLTTDGLRVLQNSNDGNFYYAKDMGFGLTITDELVHPAAYRSKSENSFVNGINAVSSISTVTQKRSHARKSSSFIGNKKGLIILAGFKDKSFKVANAKAVFDSITNYKGYHQGDFVGSVYDYFNAQSGGLFNLSFDVVGPITLPKTMAYYGKNDMNGDDQHPGEMVATACQMVDDSVNFADYDWNGDKSVDQVYVLYAGYGENADSRFLSSTIWPHEWDLSESDYGKTLVLDGDTINTYACSNELMYGNSTMQIEGIGTICHEFSHCLGLPDFYDTDSQSTYGMYEWDLLDYGSYNDDGFCPAGYTSYEKWFCGWEDPIELTTDCSVDNVKALSEGGQSYVIYNDQDKNEYYLLENRQLTHWDEALPGKGLLVLHVDYDEDVWYNNVVNNTSSHQRMTIVHADNTSSMNESSVSGDIYPYNTNDSLTNSSKPAATLFNANIDGRKYMNKPIRNIRQNDDGSISFSFENKNTTPNKIDLVKMMDGMMGKAVVIYDLSGNIVEEINSFAGTGHLRHGTYVIKDQQGHAVKFVVK
jgi:immune inhibitor A